MCLWTLCSSGTYDTEKENNSLLLLSYFFLFCENVSYICNLLDFACNYKKIRCLFCQMYMKKNSYNYNYTVYCLVLHRNICLHLNQKWIFFCLVFMFFVFCIYLFYDILLVWLYTATIETFQKHQSKCFIT